MILQGAEAGSVQAVGAVGSGGAQSLGAGAAIAWGAEIPPAPWSCHLWELKEKVIGNGLPWGYPSSRSRVCAHNVCVLASQTQSILPVSPWGLGYTNKYRGPQRG